MEIRELKKLINIDMGKRGDEDDDDIAPHNYLKDVQNLFIKKFFSKHGWDFILMSR
jgi:hypothetical protein